MPQLTIYFQKPADWADTVHIHYWNAQPGNRASVWPGVPMIAEDDGWFVHRFDGASVADRLRSTFGFRKVGGRWRLVHEHVKVRTDSGLVRMRS